MFLLDCASGTTLIEDIAVKVNKVSILIVNLYYVIIYLYLC